MKASELRAKSPEELVRVEAELREEIFRLQLKLRMGQLPSAVGLRRAHRDLARVKTVATQRAASEG